MLVNFIYGNFEKNPDLRVLFHFDSNREFEQEVNELKLENILVVKFDHNFFNLKVKLYGEWLDQKVFLYFPIESPHKTGKYLAFPLMDLLEANKELLLDDEDAFMEEFGLARYQKNVVKKYIKELKYNKVQEVCRGILNQEAFDEASLQQGLISAFLGFTKYSNWSLLIAKSLVLALPEKEIELKRFLKKLHENGLMEVFSKKLCAAFGVKHQPSISVDRLKDLLLKIRYNQITFFIAEPMKEDPYAHLKIKEKQVLTGMNQLVQEAIAHPQINGKFQEALEWAGEMIKGVRIIQLYGQDIEYGYLTDDMCWQILMAQVEILDYNPQTVIKKTERILSLPELTQGVKSVANLLIQSGNMIGQLNRISSYTLNNPGEYIHEYVSRWSKIDYHYRKAILAYREVEKVDESFDLDSLYALINNRYDSHLEKLNREWLKCFSEFGFDYKLIKTPKQYDFFKNHLASSEVKSVVIISDALRYEAAEELLGLMHGDHKNVAELEYQLASIPSKTSIGMAQLLPGKERLYNDGKISIDGTSTDGIDNRQAILREIDGQALAVQYSQIEKLSIKEAREIFKAPLVYVYHDVIDATGDKKASERRTFKAVEEALQELAKFANKVHHTFNVTKVFITADHGFIYNDQQIDEKDKENGSGKDMASHNRYELHKEPLNPKLGYCISLAKTTAFKDGNAYYVLIPESTNRYKKQGVGHQFVHGGGSLQELIVPVINSYRKIQSIATKVRPIITNESQLRIVSNILRVNLIQEKKVSRNEKEIQLVVGLYKDSQLVSNEVVLELNSISESPSERMHKFELVLNSSAAKESFFKLKVFDLEDRLNPLIEIRVNNQTLIQPDF
jgi:hypothetical protein